MTSITHHETKSSKDVTANPQVSTPNHHQVYQIDTSDCENKTNPKDKRKDKGKEKTKTILPTFNSDPP